MTALAAARTEPRFEIWEERKVELANDAKVWAGGIVCLDTAQGYFIQATTSTTLINCGIAQESVDNTGGADGDLTVNVKFHRPIRGRWYLNDGGGDAVAKANRGSKVYLKDDQTVTTNSGTNTRSYAGRAWEVATIDGASCVFVEAFAADL